MEMRKKEDAMKRSGGKKESSPVWRPKNHITNLGNTDL